MNDDAGRARLEAAIEPLGVPYELFPCDPALADTAQFCEAYGFSPGESANTIVVVGKADPRVYAACIVLATHRLDVNRAVRDKLGTRKASFASADETRELTGMEIGGVTPVGLPDGPAGRVGADGLVRPPIILGGGQPELEGDLDAVAAVGGARRRGRRGPREPRPARAGARRVGTWPTTATSSTPASPPG